MKSNKGLTLIELLIVVIIVGILAAIAIPSYTGYMQRARRADAKVALEQFRAAQEMRRAERGSYSTSLVELRNTWGVPAVAGDYNIDFDDLAAVLTANTYTAEATPVTARQLGDGSLFIDNRGTKTPADKWAK
ncbi:MAG: type IV pilin protein [Thermodesulfobacteriota bacterium]|nr:type IV pilin protein [Thermodesulfobacteriota bacterium]